MELPPDLPQGSLPRVADFLVRRHRWILLATVVIVGLSAWRASKLSLKTNFAELLPENDPAVVVLKEMASRLNALSTIVVVVESPDPKVNRRFVNDLVPKLQALKGRTEGIADVEWGVHSEREFIRRNRFLYPPVKQLQEAHDRIRREIVRRKNPVFVDLDDEGDGESLSAQQAEIDKKEQKLLGRFPDGYFATKDEKVYAIVVRVEGSIFSERSGEKLVEEVNAVINAAAPARYHPQLRVGLTGDIPNTIQEREALEDDLIVASTACVILVCIVIILFFGRFRAVPFATVPALCGVTVAMAYAQIAFGYLNASTAFMGSIIVGNGINYAIIQMARYEEERRLGREVREAIAAALGTTWRPTLIASLGAAIAYGSLSITSFRGFSQFGYIGGVGMVLAWIFTVVTLPALWAFFDRRTAVETIPRVRGFAVAAPLARFTTRHPRLLLGVGAALTIAAVVPLPEYLKDPFEYDFRNLGNRLSQKEGASRLSYKIDPIFDRTLAPNFVLADDPKDVEEIRKKLREQDQRFNILGTITTINDFLPGSAEEQRQKLAILSRIRRLIDDNVSLLDEKELADAKKLRPPDGLKVLGPRDLPMAVRRYFTEADGTVGRPIAYYARHGVTVWDGRTQIKLAEVTKEVRLDDGRTIRSSGKPAIFAGMLTAIGRDGPIATLAALLGVALLVVILTFRRGGGWLVVAVLLLGVVWMVGAAAYANERVNFLNFIALPITFGINIDYGINLLLRYQVEGRGRVGPAVAAAGGAVALCSMTTIIGYGALLTADNQALNSFGGLAILGEFACLAAALLIMPALMIVLEGRHPRATSASLLPSSEYRRVKVKTDAEGRPVVSVDTARRSSRRRKANPQSESGAGAQEAPTPRDPTPPPA